MLKEFDRHISGWNRRLNDLQSFVRSNLATKPTKILLAVAHQYVWHTNKFAYNTKTFATRTGLEPATSAVTGRRANQLRYRALRD